MTEPKFTPGPYCVETAARYFFVSSKQGYLIGGLENNETGEANAHLFAASFELYAELARIDPTNPVLAKARGEMPASTGDK